MIRKLYQILCVLSILFVLSDFILLCIYGKTTVKLEDAGGIAIATNVLMMITIGLASMVLKTLGFDNYSLSNLVENNQSDIFNARKYATYLFTLVAVICSFVTWTSYQFGNKDILYIIAIIPCTIAMFTFYIGVGIVALIIAFFIVILPLFGDLLICFKVARNDKRLTINEGIRYTLAAAFLLCYATMIITFLALDMTKLLKLNLTAYQLVIITNICCSLLCIYGTLNLLRYVITDSDIQTFTGLIMIRMVAMAVLLFAVIMVSFGFQFSFKKEMIHIASVWIALVPIILCSLIFSCMVLFWISFGIGYLIYGQDAVSKFEKCFGLLCYCPKKKRVSFIEEGVHVQEYTPSMETVQEIISDGSEYRECTEVVIHQQEQVNMKENIEEVKQ